MNDHLDIIKYLYGEGDAVAMRERLEEDQELWSEYQALSDVKFRLDHRRPQRPDPRVLNAIMGAAAGEAPRGVPRRFRDRPPVASRRYGTGILGVAGVVVMVLMSVMTWRVILPEADRQPAELAMTDEAARPAPLASDTAASPDPSATAGLASTPPVPAEAQARAAAATQMAAVGEEASAVDQRLLEWNQTDDVLRLHRRIQLLRAGTDLAWDEPAVPLEMMPPPSGASSRNGLQQAGQRRHLP